MTAAGPGMYTVLASFAGAHAYWPSQAESSFAIGAAAATPAPTSAPPESTALTHTLFQQSRVYLFLSS
jgi:hypothetical protein